MAEYEKVRNMPLADLLVYHNALKAICEGYEKRMTPLFNSQKREDALVWMETNNELQYAKKYYDIVLNAMKYKAFNGLDSYGTEPVKEKKTYKKESVKKPPVKPKK